MAGLWPKRPPPDLADRFRAELCQLAPESSDEAHLYEVAFAMAIQSYLLGDNLSAIDYLYDYIEYMSNADAEVYLLLGIVHAELEEIEQAENAFKKVLELEPKNVEATLRYAWLKLYRGTKDADFALAATLIQQIDVMARTKKLAGHFEANFLDLKCELLSRSVSARDRDVVKDSLHLYPRHVGLHILHLNQLRKDGKSQSACIHMTQNMRKMRHEMRWFEYGIDFCRELLEENATIESVLGKAAGSTSPSIPAADEQVAPAQVHALKLTLFDGLCALQSKRASQISRETLELSWQNFARAIVAAKAVFSENSLLKDAITTAETNLKMRLAELLISKRQFQLAQRAIFAAAPRNEIDADGPISTADALKQVEQRSHLAHLSYDAHQLAGTTTLQLDECIALDSSLIRDCGLVTSELAQLTEILVWYLNRGLSSSVAEIFSNVFGDLPVVSGGGNGEYTQLVMGLELFLLQAAVKNSLPAAVEHILTAEDHSIQRAPPLHPLALADAESKAAAPQIESSTQKIWTSVLYYLQQRANELSVQAEKEEAEARKKAAPLPLLGPKGGKSAGASQQSRPTQVLQKNSAAIASSPAVLVPPNSENCRRFGFFVPSPADSSVAAKAPCSLHGDLSAILKEMREKRKESVASESDSLLELIATIRLLQFRAQVYESKLLKSTSSTSEYYIHWTQDYLDFALDLLRSIVGRAKQDPYTWERVLHRLNPASTSLARSFEHLRQAKLPAQAELSSTINQPTSSEETGVFSLLLDVSTPETLLQLGEMLYSRLRLTVTKQPTPVTEERRRIAADCLTQLSAASALTPSQEQLRSKLMSHMAELGILPAPVRASKRRRSSASASPRRRADDDLSDGNNRSTEFDSDEEDEEWAETEDEDSDEFNTADEVEEAADDERDEFPSETTDESEGEQQYSSSSSQSAAVILSQSRRRHASPSPLKGRSSNSASSPHRRSTSSQSPAPTPAPIPLPQAVLDAPLPTTSRLAELAKLKAEIKAKLGTAASPAKATAAAPASTPSPAPAPAKTPTVASSTTPAVPASVSAPPAAVTSSTTAAAPSASTAFGSAAVPSQASWGAFAGTSSVVSTLASKSPKAETAPQSSNFKFAPSPAGITSLLPAATQPPSSGAGFGGFSSTDSAKSFVSPAPAKTAAPAFGVPADSSKPFGFGALSDSTKPFGSTEPPKTAAPAFGAPLDATKSLGSTELAKTTTTAFSLTTDAPKPFGVIEPTKSTAPAFGAPAEAPKPFAAVEPAKTTVSTFGMATDASKPFGTVEPMKSAVLTFGAPAEVPKPFAVTELGKTTAPAFGTTTDAPKPIVATESTKAATPTFGAPAEAPKPFGAVEPAKPTSLAFGVTTDSPKPFGLAEPTKTFSATPTDAPKPFGLTEPAKTASLTFGAPKPFGAPEPTKPAVPNSTTAFGSIELAQPSAPISGFGAPAASSSAVAEKPAAATPFGAFGTAKAAEAPMAHPFGATTAPFGSNPTAPTESTTPAAATPFGGFGSSAAPFGSIAAPAAESAKSDDKPAAPTPFGASAASINSAKPAFGGFGAAPPEPGKPTTSTPPPAADANSQTKADVSPIPFASQPAFGFSTPASTEPVKEAPKPSFGFGSASSIAPVAQSGFVFSGKADAKSAVLENATMSSGDLKSPTVSITGSTSSIKLDAAPASSSEPVFFGAAPPPAPVAASSAAVKGPENASKPDDSEKPKIEKKPDDPISAGFVFTGKVDDKSEVLENATISSGELKAPAIMTSGPASSIRLDAKPSESAPVSFSFGKVEEKAEAKPAATGFSFGTTASPFASPAFGAKVDAPVTKADDKSASPSFSFGASPAATSETQKQPAPSSGFMFGGKADASTETLKDASFSSGDLKSPTISITGSTSGIKLDAAPTSSTPVFFGAAGPAAAAPVAPADDTASRPVEERKIAPSSESAADKVEKASPSGFVFSGKVGTNSETLQNAIMSSGDLKAPVISISGSAPSISLVAEATSVSAPVFFGTTPVTGSKISENEKAANVDAKGTEAPDTKPAAALGFSFGGASFSPAAAAAPSTPTGNLGFGIDSDVAKKVGEEKAESKPAFSGSSSTFAFGSKVDAPVTKADDKPASPSFSFGASPAATSETQKQPAPSSGFMFGGKADASTETLKDASFSSGDLKSPTISITGSTSGIKLDAAPTSSTPVFFGAAAQKENVQESDSESEPGYDLDEHSASSFDAREASVNSTQDASIDQSAEQHSDADDEIESMDATSDESEDDSTPAAASKPSEPAETVKAPIAAATPSTEEPKRAAFGFGSAAGPTALLPSQSSSGFSFSSATTKQVEQSKSESPQKLASFFGAAPTLGAPPPTFGAPSTAVAPSFGFGQLKKEDGAASAGPTANFGAEFAFGKPSSDPFATFGSGFASIGKKTEAAKESELAKPDISMATSSIAPRPFKSSEAPQKPSAAPQEAEKKPDASSSFSASSFASKPSSFGTGASGFGLGSLSSAMPVADKPAVTEAPKPALVTSPPTAAKKVASPTTTPVFGNPSFKPQSFSSTRLAKKHDSSDDDDSDNSGGSSDDDSDKDVPLQKAPQITVPPGSFQFAKAPSAPSSAFQASKFSSSSLSKGTESNASAPSSQGMFSSAAAAPGAVNAFSAAPTSPAGSTSAFGSTAFGQTSKIGGNIAPSGFAASSFGAGSSSGFGGGFGGFGGGASSSGGFAALANKKDSDKPN